MPLVYEARQGAGNIWRQVGPPLTSGGIGSVSHIGPDNRREVIVFACHGDTSTIALAPIGSTVIEVGLVRRIESAGLDIIATLADGEEFEMIVRSAYRGLRYIARWRHVR